jgi:hypothetical protein
MCLCPLIRPYDVADAWLDAWLTTLMIALPGLPNVTTSLCTTAMTGTPNLTVNDYRKDFLLLKITCMHTEQRGTKKKGVDTATLSHCH